MNPRSLIGRVLVLTLTLLGCGASPEDVEDAADAAGLKRCTQLRHLAPAGPIRLVIIINDTMRRDRVGAYGGSARTPVFDAFARAHLLFTNATTQSPWTKPSIATLFTGLYPSQHGVLDLRVNGRTDIVDVLRPEMKTLAELVRVFGARTAGFVANAFLTATFGYDQGFQAYQGYTLDNYTYRQRMTPAAVKWIEALEPDQAFFLYLHYYESHTPYGDLRPEDLEREQERLAADVAPVPEEAMGFLDNLHTPDGRKLLETGVKPSMTLLQMAYDRGIEEFDESLGVVLGALSRHPAWEEMAVMVTSDHGESLFERGFGNHGRNLFEVEVAIPLALRLPGTEPEGAEISCLMGLVDVLPTLCQYYGIRCPDKLPGWSFLSSAENEASDDRRYLFIEGVQYAERHRSLRNQRYKLIYEPDGPLAPGDTRDLGLGQVRPLSLYDLVRDPQETRDLLLNPGNEERRIQELLGVLAPALAGALPDHGPRIPQPGVKLDPELVERMKALGYLE